jgi:hypothetical protein
MSDITHTSTGADNTPRYLEVTGTSFGIPFQSDLWLNFQVSSGITSSEELVTSWEDLEKGCIAASMEGLAPILDSTLTGVLNTHPTVKFHKVSSEYSKLYSNNLHPPTLTHNCITVSMLIKFNTQSSMDYGRRRSIIELGVNLGVAYPYYEGSSYLALRAITGEYNFEISPSLLDGEWHVITLFIDYDLPDYPTQWRHACSIDGGGFTRTRVNKNGSFSVPTQIYLGGRIYPYDENGCEANCAAMMVWGSKIFTDDDALTAYNFLMLKYGLT